MNDRDFRCLAPAELSLITVVGAHVGASTQTSWPLIEVVLKSVTLRCQAFPTERCVVAMRGRKWS
jgi:hypothetical protein